MVTDGVAAVSTPENSSSDQSSSDDAQIFAQMVQGFLTTGMTLGNSIVGDTIDSINQDSDES